MPKRRPRPILAISERFGGLFVFVKKVFLEKNFCPVASAFACEVGVSRRKIGGDNLINPKTLSLTAGVRVRVRVARPVPME